jgi:hypothetical protein
MAIREPVGLIRMNAAENIIKNGPVSAAHLEGLTLATVHIVSAAHLYRDGIFKQPMGARHRVGRGFSYRPARLHRLAGFIL